MKTYDTDPMDLTVYATDGAPRYHSSRACQTLRNAQDLSDWDCWDDYCHHEHPRPRPVRELDLAAAVTAGKWPCHTCYKASVILPPSANTFGHAPTEFFAVRVCARCTTWDRNHWLDEWGNDHRSERYPVPVAWPCTSAIVLGLVPRPLP